MKIDILQRILTIFRYVKDDEYRMAIVEAEDLLRILRTFKDAC